MATFSPASAFAAIPERDAVRALVGEGGGQGTAELNALASALRNRGTLKGVYGFSAQRAKNPDAKTWNRCLKAWRSSQSGLDATHGAQFWLSDYDLKHCKPSRTAFRFKMKETAHIGSTHFYRELNERPVHGNG